MQRKIRRKLLERLTMEEKHYAGKKRFMSTRKLSEETDAKKKKKKQFRWNSRGRKELRGKQEGTNQKPKHPSEKRVSSTPPPKGKEGTDLQKKRNPSRISAQREGRKRGKRGTFPEKRRGVRGKKAGLQKKGEGACRGEKETGFLWEKGAGEGEDGRGGEKRLRREGMFGIVKKKDPAKAQRGEEKEGRGGTYCPSRKKKGNLSPIIGGRDWVTNENAVVAFSQGNNGKGGKKKEKKKTKPLWRNVARNEFAGGKRNRKKRGKKHWLKVLGKAI